MTLNRGMLTSDTEEWETPQPLFDAWHERFRFDVDVCSTHENAKCERHWTKEEDGLKQDWSGLRCWMNPPYGKYIAWWIRKARDSAVNGGALVVLLLPARTDTKWYHRYIYDRKESKRQGKTVWRPWVKEVDFMPGRREFKQGQTLGWVEQNTAPFPSMVVVFENALIQLVGRDESIQGEEP